MTFIQLKIPDNNPFKRRKLDMDEKTQSSKSKQNEIISMVTELESTQVLCIEIESQQSVNSKPRRSSNGNELEKNNSKGLEIKNTILNFFSRV